jgi:uncharacterized protein
MEIPIQLIVLSIPSVILIGLLRNKGNSWREAFASVGWQACKPVHFLWALGVTAITGGLAWLALQFIPPELMSSENVNIASYTGLSPSLSALLFILIREGIYTALGEEVFFRGWLGGWLVRRFGFITGNTIQAFIFLLPHLLLLTVGLGFWPILIPQFVAGWLLGWLRHRSGSILPAWLAHTLANALSAWSNL